MIVRFVNQQSKFPVAAWRDLIGRVLPAALAATLIGRQFRRLAIDTVVSVTFAGSRVMRRINAATRQVDSLTDVLSFPLLDAIDGHLLQPPGIQDFDPEFADQPTVVLGDIVICLDRAFSQAADYGHSREREVAFLAIHGLLHLTGFDHQDEKSEKAMLRKQKQILDQAGLGRGVIYE
jgi:probable rRNA maturation factor